MDPKIRNVIVVLILVVLVAAGIGAYELRPKGGSNETSVIKIDQAEIPDSLDPAVTFSTPGWAAVQQVYQGLVNYDGTSSTTFSGILANNWSESTDGLHWNFTLRSGVHFSNGDPYNAYVQWYSLYRSLLLEQGPQFILEQNFFTPSLTAGSGLSYYSNLTPIQAANATLVSDLNSWDFSSPSASAITAMELPNQSFRVIDAQTIQLNVGFGYLGSVPYTYLLASLSAPSAYAVDPIVVDANGGVVEGQPNSYLSEAMLGTGPYTLQEYSNLQGAGYTLQPDPNYWGNGAANSNPMIQPANTSVQVIFQDSQAITISDLTDGLVQAASFAYIGPDTVTQLQGVAGVTAQPLPTVFGSTSGAWWIYLDQNQYPFNNLSVREAVAHAINYTQIIDQAFGGYAQQWVGPVPPAYPYANPGGLSPYDFDLSLAQQEIANSPCADNACASDTIQYSYLQQGTSWAETAQYLVSDLSKIGLTIKPVPITLDNLYSEQTADSNGVCASTTSLNGGPFPMGQEFYTSDYISPDDWTQNDAVSTGSANACMSQYANSTMDTLVYQAAAESNPANLTSDYTQMTSLMYQNYTDIWLVVPTSFAVYSTHLHGFLQNPMASAEPFAIGFNTDWLD